MDQQEEAESSSWGGIWKSGGANEESSQSPISKKDKPVYEPTFDDSIEKFIRLDTESAEFKHFLAHKSKLLAEVISVGTIKFDVELERVKVDRDDHKDLIVHVVCHRDGLDPHWRCTFQCDVTVTVGDSDAKTSGQKSDARHKDNSLTMPIMRLPSAPIDDAFMIVEIKMSKWKGIFPRLVHDFTKENEYTNATLVVDEQQLHVTREMLAIHSAFFNNLFFNEHFADASKDEYQLTDVSLPDLLLFLNLSYPETMVGRREQFVTSIDDLERALLLSEQFSAPAIKNLAERMLKNAGTNFPGVSWTHLLYIADRFRLSEACSTQMRRLSTDADFIRLRRSEEFELLSERLRSKLLTAALEKLPPSTTPRRARIASRTGRIGQFSDVEVDDDDSSDVEFIGHTTRIPTQTRPGVQLQDPRIPAQTYTFYSSATSQPVAASSSSTAPAVASAAAPPPAPPPTPAATATSQAVTASQRVNAIMNNSAMTSVQKAKAILNSTAALRPKMQLATRYVYRSDRDPKKEVKSEEDDSEEEDGARPGPSHRPVKRTRGVTTRSRAKRTKK